MYNQIIKYYLNAFGYACDQLNTLADALQDCNEDFGFIPLDHSLMEIYEAIDSIIDALGHLDASLVFLDNDDCSKSEK